MARPQKSLKVNFLYNAAFKLLNILFPLITFPYVARIISVDGIGKVNYTLAIIEYFILISQFGIPTYAIRECAKYRDDKVKLSKTVQEILLINVIMIVLSYAMFFGMLDIKAFHNYKTLLLIMSINIITTNLGVEWFYQAIEEYKIITVRNLLVKIVSIILIFTLIKNESDYILYGLIIVISTALGYLLNFYQLRKYIHPLKRFSNYNIKKHIKPILVLFAMAFTISIYLNLDKVMLGLMSGDKAVGIYTASNKMVKMVLALVTALSTVMLPRMSYYIDKGLKDEINNLIKKSLDFIFMISIPSTIGIVMLSKQLILFFAGNDFTEAIFTLKILSPIIIAIALSNLTGIQILMAHGKERLVLVSTIFGAVINLLLNLILIPMFQQNGAAIATLIAEIAVTLIQFKFSFSYIKSNIKIYNIINYFIGGFLIFITCTVLNMFIKDILLSTIIDVFLSILVYITYLYITKNEIINEILEKFVRKIRQKNT